MIGGIDQNGITIGYMIPTHKLIRSMISTHHRRYEGDLSIINSDAGALQFGGENKEIGVWGRALCARPHTPTLFLPPKLKYAQREKHPAPCQPYLCENLSQQVEVG